jgi:hypothetical protein
MNQDASISSRLINKSTLALAEDLDIELYANNTWLASLEQAEMLRRQIWSREYAKRPEMFFGKRALTSDQDEFE